MEDKMKQRKGFGVIAAIVVIALFTLVTVFAVPGVANGLITAATIVPQPCEDTPQANNCLCGDGEERLVIDQTIDTYFCEDINKFIDPTSTTFEQESIDYAEEYMNSEFPTCTMRSCSMGEGAWEVRWTYGPSGESIDRKVIVTCNDRELRYAETSFDVEDGSIGNLNSCTDFVPGQEDIPVLALGFAGLGPGFNMANIEYDLDCAGTGTAQQSFTYVLEETENDATAWWFHGMGRPQTFEFLGEGSCTLVNKQGRQVTLDCEATCTTFAGYSGSMPIRWENTQ